MERSKLSRFFPRTEAAPDPSRKPESRPSHRQEDAEMPGFESISQFFFWGEDFFLGKGKLDACCGVGVFLLRP